MKLIYKLATLKTLYSKILPISWVSMLLFYCTAPLTHAQVTSGGIDGRVADKAGEGLSGANIVALHVPSGTKSGTISRNDGGYNLANLRTGGPYTITVSYVGYKDQVQENVFLQLGVTSTIDFALEEESITLNEVQIVYDRSGTFNDTRMGTGTNVGREQLQQLPSLSRSLQDFTRLTPQTNGANSFGGANFRYNNITFDGAANNDAFGFSPSSGGVSGFGASGTPGSQARTQPISLDAIQEVQVVLTPYDVKLGNFTGGSLNAVTRSGTNQVQGSAYAFWRNQALAGKSPDAARSSLQTFYDYQAGVRIGGPILKDKLFFFLNYDQARRQEPVLYGAGQNGSQISYSDAKTLHDVVQQRYGIDIGAYSGSAYKINTTSDKIFARLDWNISPNHQLTLRHNLVIAQAGSLDRGASLLKYSSQDYVFHSTTNGTVAELKSQFGSRFSNSLILGYQNIQEFRTLVSDPTPQVEINYYNGAQIYFGTDRESYPYRTRQQIIEFTDNFNFYFGKHTFTFGTHNEYYDINYYFLQAANGRWNYSSLNAFYLDQPSQIRQAYNRSDPTENQRNYNELHPTASFGVLLASLYAQDEWSVKRTLKLSLGMRVDYPWLPKYQDTNPTISSGAEKQNSIATFSGVNNKYLNNPQIAPRVGFNWDVKGNKSLQLRGGTGIFNGRIPFAWLAYAFYNTGVNYGFINYSPTYNTSLTAIPFDPKPANANNNPLIPDKNKNTTEVNLIANNFKLPQVWKSSLAVDAKLPYGLVGTLEGTWTSTINDILFQDINRTNPTLPILSTGVNANGIQADQRPAYNLAASSQQVDGNNFTNVYYLSNTHAGYRYTATASLQKRFDFGLSGQVAYTYGKAKDVSNGVRNSPQSNFEYNQAPDANHPGLTYSNFDLRHRIVASATYRRAWNKMLTSTISLVYTGQSGSPYTFNYNGNLAGTAGPNNILYVPRQRSEINLVDYLDVQKNAIVTAAQQWSDLDKFISADPYLKDHRGGYVQRNGPRTPWNHDLDLRLMQDFNFEVGNRIHTLQLTLDIINFSNLLNHTWGRLYYVPNINNYTVYLVNYQKGPATAPITVDGAQRPDLVGQPTFTYLNGYYFGNKPLYSVDQLLSRWQAQVGVRYLF